MSKAIGLNLNRHMTDKYQRFSFFQTPTFQNFDLFSHPAVSQHPNKTDSFHFLSLTILSNQTELKIHKQTKTNILESKQQ